MSHKDSPETAGAQAQAEPTSGTRDMRRRGSAKQSDPAARAEPDPVAGTERKPAAGTDPNPATATASDADARADRDPVTYEAGWDSTAGTEAVLLQVVVYAWWLFIGGTFQILFGGMYLGSAQQAQLHVSTPWLDLFYVVTGVFMVTLGFGILRLERWVYWAGWLASLAYGAASVIEIVRWLQGTPIVAETVFFCGLNFLFLLYNAYMLSTPDVRTALRFGIFKGSPFSPGMALCGVALAVPALAATLFINHIDKHLSDPTLALVYLLGSVLVIVMAFMAVRVRAWVWWAGLVWVAILTGLSVYMIAHEVTHLIRGTSVDTQGLIFAGVNLLFIAIVVYYLFLDDVRSAALNARKQPLFSPRTLIGGLSLGVFAVVIYLFEGDLGKLSIAYTVVGLAMGAVVGLLPGADPANRISAYFAGLLLAFASYVARGGLLPYTKGAAAVVVLLMLVVVTGITAVVRSRAWFVLMLLGVGTMYGLVELQFQAAPIAYFASAGLALVGILLGFGVGFTVSELLELELVPYKPNPVLAAQTSAGSRAASGDPAPDNTHAKEDPR